MKIKEKIVPYKFYIQAFFIPLGLIFLFAFLRGLAPFGKYNLMAIDAWGQYFPMLRQMERAFFSGNMGYSFSGALGFDLAAQSAYYTNSPLWILAFLIPGPLMPWEVDLIVFLRFALAGLTFAFFLSEKFHKKDISIVIFSCAYAFSGYTIAYINQLMWMDAVVLLPLVILGIERIFQGKKGLLYFISLALTILSNFYIGFAVCIFSVLWFILTAVNEYKGVKTFLISALRWILCSLGAGFINLPVLLHVIGAIKNTIASDLEFTGEIKVYNGLLDYLKMLLPFHKSSLAYHLPNIYFGFICLILVFFAIFYKTALKKKITYVLLSVFLLLSFNINILDFIWHGFHFPNQLPARQSFLFIFTAIIMSYAGYLVIYETIAKTDIQKKRTLNTVCSLICIEIILNSTMLFMADIKSVSHNSIMRDSTAMSEVAEDFTPDLKKNEFWRIEKQPTRYNGGQLHGYYGISHYSSTMSGDCYNFFKNLGMGIYAQNVSTEYKANPVLNALFGIRYIVSNEASCDEVSSFIKQADNMYIYENNKCLPIAYTVSENIKNVNMNLRGFELANDIFRKAADCDNVISADGMLYKDEFIHGFNKLYESSIEITDIKNTYIEGNINCKASGVLMISLPANDIKIYIDGEKKDTIKIADYMGGADIEQGEHHIKIKF